MRANKKWRDLLQIGWILSLLFFYAWHESQQAGQPADLSIDFADCPPADASNLIETFSTIPNI